MAGDAPRSGASTAAPVRGARPDPRADAVPGQEFIYEGIQSLWSAVARLRYRSDFEQVAAFGLFVGYPRSGHSLVGAMLNAHPDAVIAHELDVLERVEDDASRDDLFGRLLGRAAWFNLRGNRSNYRYQIPGQWQGRFRALRVIGDKGGGWAVQRLAKEPELLDRLRETVDVPIRLIHVVRNPFDNIAAMSLWHRMPTNEATDFYFSHCETTARLYAELSPEEMATVRHENFIADAEAALSELCGFLGLEADPAYLAACAGIVFRRPTRTRTKLSWTDDEISTVQRRMQSYPFFESYRFAAEEDVTGGDSSTPHAQAGQSTRPESLLRRLAAAVSPRRRSAG